MGRGGGRGGQFPCSTTDLVHTFVVTFEDSHLFRQRQDLHKQLQMCFLQCNLMNRVVPVGSCLEMISIRDTQIGPVKMIGCQLQIERRGIPVHVGVQDDQVVDTLYEMRRD